MFENVNDPKKLIELRLRLRDIRMKIKNRKELSGADENYLRLNLLGKGKEFRDKKHRGELFAQALDELDILWRKFKEKGVRMELKKDEIEKIASWLNKHWKGEKLCPICGNNNWNISQAVYELRTFHGGGLVVGGPVYPVIGIVCMVCGHTLFFNAIKLGFVKPAPSQKKEGSNDE